MSAYGPPKAGFFCLLAAFRLSTDALHLSSKRALPGDKIIPVKWSYKIGTCSRHNRRHGLWRRGDLAYERVMPHTPLAISAAEGRRLILHLNGLSGAPKGRMNSSALLALIEHLGFVQLDSVQVVARAHHMILFARAPSYRPAMLRRLIEKKCDLFEHWTHDAAIIPTALYPYWRHAFRRQQGALAKRFRKWHGPGFEDAIERVLGHLQTNGAVMSRDFASKREPGAAAGWWEWNDGKTALEFLWRTGRLAIAKRQGFQKIYDLAERVIPEGPRNAEVSPEAFIDWACQGALQRLGFVTPGEIAGFWGLITTAEAKAWCDGQLGKGGKVIPVEVGAAKKAKPRRLFARADIAEAIAAAPPPPGRLRVINPFDPILRDRKRLARLFGFDFRIEIFVPAPERQYGYYVFALLEGDRLVGRIDMKADQAKDQLAVAALWMEPGLRLTPARRKRLETELNRHRRFTGLANLTFADGFLKRDG